MLKCYWQLAIIINYKVFINYKVSNGKTKCGKDASENLLNVNSLEIIWFSFLFSTFNKPLLVLVIKSLFYLFWHWLITFSYKLQVVTSLESSHSSMLLQEKMERSFYLRLLSYQKRIFPMDVFIIFQLSRIVRLPC